jgi:hypothetical protein
MELIRGTKLSESSDARVHSERMTIARLLLAQPRVVILDDARGTAGSGWAVRGIAPTQFAVQKNVAAEEEPVSGS